MKEQFLKDIKDFEITIENDNGLNRVISCRNKNGTFNRSFSIITWCNHLCISGDMGDFIYSRTEDMFDFFKQEELKINVDYWTEKMTSCSVFGGGSNRGTAYNSQKTKDNVLNYVKNNKDWYLDDRQSLEEEIEDICFEDGDIRVEDALNEAFSDFNICPETLHDLMEYGVTYHTEWCLYAIVWAIQEYDKNKKTCKD